MHDTPESTLSSIATGQTPIKEMSPLTMDLIPKLSADQMLDRIYAQVGETRFMGDFETVDKPQYFQLMNYWVSHDDPLEPIGLEMRAEGLEKALLTHEPSFWDEHIQGDYLIEYLPKDLFLARMILRLYGSPKAVLEKLAEYKDESSPIKLAEARRLVLSVHTWIDEQSKSNSGTSAIDKKLVIDPELKSLMRENLIPLLDKDSVTLDNMTGYIIAKVELFDKAESIPDNILWHCLNSESMSHLAKQEFTKRLNSANKQTSEYLASKFSDLPLNSKYQFFWGLTEDPNFGKDKSLWPVFSKRLQNHLPDQKNIDKETSAAAYHVAVGLDKMALQTGQKSGSAILAEIGGVEGARNLLNDITSIFQNLKYNIDIDGKLFRQVITAIMNSLSKLDPKAIYSWDFLKKRMLELERLPLSNEKLYRDMSEREFMRDTVTTIRAIEN